MRSLILTLILFLCPAIAAQDIFDIPTKGVTENNQRLIRHAWGEARKIGGVPKWDFPDNLSVMSYDDKVMNVIWEWDGNRMRPFENRTYGTYFEVSGVHRSTGHNVTNRYIVLYLRESEIERLSLPVLIHEMLHYVYVQRCKGEEDFYQRFGQYMASGGEEWVREVFPFNPEGDE